MKNFIAGLIMGLIIGLTGISSAQKLIGGNGFLMGWDVTYNGETICSSPFIWEALKEIECD